MLKFSTKFYLSIFFIYQLFSTAFIAIGIWPKEVIYINLLLQLAAILFFNIENAIYSVILSLPFYLVLPNSYFDTLSAWRITFAVLFAKYLWLDYVNRGKQGGLALGTIKTFVWDKYLKYLGYVALISLYVADSSVLGLKKIIFVVNIYLLYLVIFNVIKSKEQIIRMIKVVLVSLTAIIFLGFVQYLSTFFSSQYYFWQYWATYIARAYYGSSFSDTALYSNSWFSFAKGQAPTLRMFSIMPSSHTFAVLTIFALPFIGSLLFFVQKKWQKIVLWTLAFFAILALLLSGTRGVWVGILAPIVFILYFYFKHYSRTFQKYAAIPLITFFILLVASPFIQKGINAIYSGNGITNFLQRANSIYDLGESSNKGRIMIWGETLKYTAKHPLLGTGFGNFTTSLQSGDFEKTFNLPKKYITGHSLYLDILAELGLLGFIAFVYYLKSLAQQFWKFFKEHYLFTEDGLVFFVYSSALALAWLFAYSVFDGTLLSDRVLMYFFVILAASASIMRLYKKE